LGEWGFALGRRSRGEDECGFRRELRAAALPSQLALLSRETLDGLFAVSAESAPLPGAVSHLYDQPVVELYDAEERALVE
jgi:hypothetical protein